MVTQPNSIPVVSDAIHEASVVRESAVEAPGTPIRGIAIAALLGLAIWAAIIWAAVQVGGFVW
jgi:hypothetical protein